jgi:hypothetical protein
MADGLASAKANAILNAICRAVAYSETAVYVQLHVGAPGAAGTSNVAGETTRVNATSAFGTAASGGTITNTAELDWTNVTTAETYSHISLWTASTAGNFIASGSITANAVAVGDNFSIPIGDLTISLPVAS